MLGPQGLLMCQRKKEKVKSTIVEDFYFSGCIKDNLATFLTFGPGKIVPQIFHMLEASGLYIPTGTQYGFQAITKESIHHSISELTGSRGGGELWQDSKNMSPL